MFKADKNENACWLPLFWTLWVGYNNPFIEKQKIKWKTCFTVICILCMFIKESKWISIFVCVYRESQRELEEKNHEVLDLDSALKERQGELQQRAQLVPHRLSTFPIFIAIPLQSLKALFSVCSWGSWMWSSRITSWRWTGRLNTYRKVWRKVRKR